MASEPIFLYTDFGAVADSAIWGNGSCRSADMNPHQSQAFILGVFRGAGIGRVHDRYIISPRQVHDRIYQI
jgi:hypothetical protein